MGQNDNAGDANRHPITKLGGPFEPPPKTPPQSQPDGIGQFLQQHNGPGSTDCAPVYSSHKNASQLTALEFDSCYYGQTHKNGRSLELKTPVMTPDEGKPGKGKHPAPKHDKKAPEKEKMPVPKLESITTEGLTIDSRRLDVFQHALPAVRPLSFQTPDGKKNVAGTGTMITDDGLMVTNKHVVDGSNGTLQVKLLRPDGTEEIRNAHVVKENPNQDLVLLQVDRQPDEKFAYLPISKRTDWLEREPTVEIGNANGEGKISMAKARFSSSVRQSDLKLDEKQPDVFPGREMYGTDATVPHGFSGGALLSVPSSERDSSGNVHRLGTSALRGITDYSDLEHKAYVIPAARVQFLLDKYLKEQAAKKK